MDALVITPAAGEEAPAGVVNTVKLGVLKFARFKTFPSRLTHRKPVQGQSAQESSATSRDEVIKVPASPWSASGILSGEVMITRLPPRSR